MLKQKPDAKTLIYFNHDRHNKMQRGQLPGKTKVLSIQFGAIATKSILLSPNSGEGE